MNLKPTRNGFIFWIAAPSGNLDPASKSISVWNIFCLMPSSGELEHFDPPVAWSKKMDQKRISNPPLKYISVGNMLFFWYQCFVFLIPHSIGIVSWLVSLSSCFDLDAWGAPVFACWWCQTFGCIECQHCDGSTACLCATWEGSSAFQRLMRSRYWRKHSERLAMAAFACRLLLTSKILATSQLTGLIWIVAECACEQAAGHPQYQKLQQVGVDGQVSDKERMCIIMPLTCRLCLGMVFSQLTCT